MSMEVALVVFALLCVLASRYMHGTYFHPVGVLAIVVAFAMFGKLTLTSFSSADSFAQYCIVILLAACVLLPLGSLAPPRSFGLETGLTRLGTAIVAASAFLGAFAGLAVQIAAGRSVSLDLASLMEGAEQASVVRYSSGTSAAALVSISFAGVFLAAMLAPYAASMRNPIVRSLLLASPIIGAVLYAMLTTARAPFTIAVALLAASWMGRELLKHGNRARVPPRTALMVILISAGVVIIFAGASFIRYGGVTPQTTEIVRARLGTYAFGALPAFDQWLLGADVPPIGTGVAWIPSAPSPSSAIAQFAQIGNGVSTNVYTALRTFIEGWGSIGGAIAVLVFLTLAIFAYRRVIEHGQVRAGMLFACLTGFLLYFCYAPVFEFSNYAAAAVVGVAFAPALVLTRRLDTRPAIDAQRLPNHERH
ncbi:hypothetical protein ACFWN7_13835 [Agromyces sp. NPDC058484]|uniref:hypothetical protein n=1 Tax=Agromyces sp. NPDC058484 TaxID=3346524 RepID=UPI00365D876B